MINLCRMFHCTPSQLDREDAEIIRLVAIYQMGVRTEEVE